jgi:glycosyltransferase involved in cell wall biosynthesis
MNLLIFPEYPYPSNHVVVEMVYERLLPQRGNKVYMIRPKSEVQKVLFEPTSIANTSLLVFPAESLGSTSRNVLRAVRKVRWVSKALELLAETPLDLVMVRNDLIYGRLALAFAKKRRIPFVFQISSPDAEFRIRQGRQGRSIKGYYSIMRGLLDLSLRRRLCRQADVVLAISSAMRQYMLTTEGLDASKCFSFPMGFNDQCVNDTEKVIELRRHLGLPHGKTIVYSGTIDPIRSPQWMIGVLVKVREEIPDATLLILSKESGEMRARFERTVAGQGQAIRIRGPLHHSEVGLYLQCADVMISPIPPLLEYKMSSPTKVLEALGVGLPVVGNDEVDEHVHVLKESGGGIAIPYDVTAFAVAITSLLRDPCERKKMGARGRQWVLEHRTYNRLTEYLEVILQAAGSKATLASLSHTPD